MTGGKQRVLVLCTGNSARSKMADGCLRSNGGERYKVSSAGSHPTGQVHLTARQVMAEMGIDIGDHTSKHVGVLAGQFFDYVITVCDNAAEACPIFPGKAERLHRDFPDPAKAPPEHQLVEFRRVRDAIAACVSEIFEVDAR